MITTKKEQQIPTSFRAVRYLLLQVMIRSIYSILICTRKQYTASRRFACYHIYARSKTFFVCFERNTADSSFCFFLDTFFCFSCSVPVSQDESTFFNLFLEFIVSVNLHDMFVAVLQCFLIDICLYFFKQILYIFFDAFARTSFLSSVSRRMISMVLFSKSRPPITRRTGTPFSS